MMDATIFRYLICLTVLKWLDLVSPETKSKLLKNKTDKYMHLGIILIGIIGLHRKVWLEFFIEFKCEHIYY